MNILRAPSYSLIVGNAKAEGIMRRWHCAQCRVVFILMRPCIQLNDINYGHASDYVDAAHLDYALH